MIVERDTKINLRPHNGRTLEQVILGLGAYKKTDDVISTFVSKLINFVSEKTNDYDFVLPKYFFPKEALSNDGYGTTSSNMTSPPISGFKKIAFVFYGEVLIHNFFEKKEKERISKQLCYMLSSCFGRGTRLFGTYEDRKKPLFNSCCLDCFANPDYIIWALKQIDDFALSEEAINSTYKTKSISTFKVIPINHPKNNAYNHINSDYVIYHGSYDKSEIVMYEPVIIEKEFKFSDEIKKLNRDKLDKLIEKSNYQNEMYSSNNDDYYEYFDSVHNNPYYNDDLDMDQQSIEFWNSI